MKNQRQTELVIYRVFDWLTAALAWLCFFLYRRQLEQPEELLAASLDNPKLYIGLLVIPLGWVILYTIFDKYSDIYRYSRWGTLVRTFVLSMVGCLLLFFTVLLDDTTYAHTNYLMPFLALFGSHFTITAVVRLILLTLAKRRLLSGKVAYNTVIIGHGPKAIELYRDLKSTHKLLGYRFLGYVDVSQSRGAEPDDNQLERLGAVSDLVELIPVNNIEEVLIALEEDEHPKLKKILEQLYHFKEDIVVKVIPDMYDIMLGKVRMTHVLGAPLIEVDQELMTRSADLMKRLMDLILSVLGILLLLPLIVFLIIKVRLSSKGPIFYSQERIGKNSLPFQIIKFRSMYTDAEKDGPQLANDTDDRRTPFGRFMRKWRLDEIPQLFNVILGDMSLVGPRPERQFFIDQIMEKEPLYRHLLSVRPGVTSWGQVKFGYASDLNQMIQRMRFDLIYLENRSLAMDIKIMLHTVLILFKGEGK